MQFAVDHINSKILKDLLKDGRKSFSDIAKECDTSKDVIAKRFKQMQVRGIINGATIHVSPRFLGGNIVALLFIFVQQQKNSNEVFQQAIKLPQVVTVFPVGLNPSLATVVVTEHPQDLEQVKQAIKSMPSIMSLDTHIITGMRNNPDNLSVLENNHRGFKERLPIQEADHQTKIDPLDRQIIQKLLINARSPFSRIAEELQVATSTVAKRYEQLKRSGDLRVVIQINPLKLGYPYFAIVRLNFSQITPNMIDALAELPDVNFVQETSGKIDYILSLMVRNLEQIVSLKDYLSCLAGVTNIEIAIERMFPAWPLPKEFTMII